MQVLSIARIPREFGDVSNFLRQKTSSVTLSRVPFIAVAAIAACFDPLAVQRKFSYYN